MALVKAVREAVGPDIDVMVDSAAPERGVKDEPGGQAGGTSPSPPRQGR